MLIEKDNKGLRAATKEEEERRSERREENKGERRAKERGGKQRVKESQGEQKPSKEQGAERQGEVANVHPVDSPHRTLETIESCGPPPLTAYRNRLPQPQTYLIKVLPVSGKFK